MDKSIESLKPMLLESVTDAFNNKDWIFEYKWDGFRALAFIENETTLVSRNAKNLNSSFPELLSLEKYFPTGTVIDGEIIAYNGRKGCFSKLLQRTRKTSNPMPVKFILFDILVSCNKSLLQLPLIERKQLLPVLKEKNIHTVDFIEERGIQVFDLARQNNFEGIVAKKKSSLYYSGRRCNEWLKIKFFIEGNFEVVGFRLLGKIPHTVIITDKEQSFFQELLLTEKTDKKLTWFKMLEGFITQRDKDLVYFKRVLGAKIRYLEQTEDKKLRHAKLIDFFALR